MGSVKNIAAFLIFSVMLILAYPVNCATLPGSYSTVTDSRFQLTEKEVRVRLSEFMDALQKSDYSKTDKLQIYFDSLIKNDLIINRIDLSDAYYFCGYYHLDRSNYSLAYDLFIKSAGIRENMGLRDSRYRRIMLNLGGTFFKMGRFKETSGTYNALIELIIEQDGDYAIENIRNYNNLASAHNELKDYEKAIAAAQRGIEIFEHHNGGADINELLRLYNNLGISYSRRNDYSRALLYLSRAYDIIRKNPGDDISIYVSVVNSLTIINTRLGNREAAREYYNDAYPVAAGDPSEYSFLLVSNYAYFLAEEGRLHEAQSIMYKNVQRALSVFGRDNRSYYEMVERYALLLSRFNIDSDKALDILEKEAIPFALSTRDDILLLRDIYHSYANVLRAHKRHTDALRAIQTALYPHLDKSIPEHDNPERIHFTPDRTGLALLTDKINILRDLYFKTNDTIYLSRAIGTNKYLIASVETVRIEISEEESRNLLGDNYRQEYNGIISNLYLMYMISDDDRYFRQAFEYAERSKAAGLLASIREIKASQFLIPDSLSNKERELERELGVIREMITRELAMHSPDKDTIMKLREEEYNTVEKRSALASHFEKEYPEYYTAKYNSSVAGIDDIMRRTGRKATYLNYVFTDTMLYAFVINHKYKEMVGIRIDSTIFHSINQFRKLLLKQSASSDHRSVFQEICITGHDLYKMLVMPVRNLLTTEKLIISPDNILSYIPFEALISTQQSRDDLLYREMDFLLKEFEISYTYSATMFVESVNRHKAFRNPVLALAPVYKSSINRDSVLNSRQVRQDTLFDLPYAREEASFVAARLGGELYINIEAKESVYKSRASLFPVLHLAMHTIINDIAPAYSRLIFSDTNDGQEDGLLNTYEIYSIPISAAMVVVSSCNTGSGRLRAGEGVMSLARSFINAGSQSVVMSLWEVDDKWGQEVIKSFYDNLKKGMSKSHSLRKAKIDFIEATGQFQSHPYYWSTLVLYGNDTPLFFDLKRILIRMILIITLLTLAARTVYRARQ